MTEEESEEGWVSVIWDHGEDYNYRWGADDAYDLEIIHDDQPESKDEVGRHLSGSHMCLILFWSIWYCWMTYVENSFHTYVHTKSMGSTKFCMCVDV